MIKLTKRLFILLLVVSVAAGMTGCKSQKKLSKQMAEKEYAMKVDKAKQDLMDILNDNTSMTLDQKENAVADIKNQKLNDPEVKKLLKQAEEKLAKERSDLNNSQMVNPKQKEEVNVRKEMTNSTLSDYFSNIANASSTSEANMYLNDAIGMFASPEVPVLIIISRVGSVVDYDRPTTIQNYLNYLKDTKNNINKVDKITYDTQGKITELELIKIK
jgi:hypothetical protein